MGLMDFFKGKEKAPTTSEKYYRYGSNAITSFWGGSTELSEEEALKIPAFASGLDIITSSFAQLPIMLIKRNDETNEVKKEVNDPRVKLLNDEPNETLNSYNFKKELARNFLLYGAGTFVLEKDGNDIIALHLLQQENVEVTKFTYDYFKKDWSLIYRPVGSSEVEISKENLVMALRDSDDGIIGRGILKYNSDILENALEEKKFSKNILKNGALPMSVLETEGKLSAQAFNNLKESWAKLYTGSKNAGKTVILEDGLKYRAVSLNPNDLQLTESRKDNLSDIARILNIPEAMLNSNTTRYSTNEQNNLNFLQYCLGPILTSFESAMNKTMLLETEKDMGYEFKFDTSQMLRTTRKELAEAVAAEYSAGLITFWEARADLNRSKTVSDDFVRMSLGSVLYKYDQDEYIIPNTMQSKAVIQDQQKQQEQLEEENKNGKAEDDKKE